jgi:hypothetical protein
LEWKARIGRKGKGKIKEYENEMGRNPGEVRKEGENGEGGRPKRLVRALGEGQLDSGKGWEIEG